MRRSLLVLAVAALVAGCSGSGAPRPAGPHSTATNPGPNTTGVTNPGPNSTAGGPQTVNGTLAVIAGRCARLTPSSGTRTYELRLPSGLTVSAAGLSVQGQLTAHPSDDVFVAGFATTTAGTCGTIVFAVTQLVSVQPAR